MAEENQNHNLVDPSSLTVKRKRGRPRKDDTSVSESAKRRPYRKSEHAAQVGDVLVGQSVSGVLDGKFDAGYMLTVTVGNTGAVLTGVVFEPGRTVPISAANDVAPHVEMLKRADVSFPSTGHLSQPRLKKDEVTVSPKDSTLRLLSEDLNLKSSSSPLLHTTKVELGQVPVPSNAAQLIYSDIRTSSSASFHESGDHAIQFSDCKAKEIQAADILDKKATQLEDIAKGSTTDSPREIHPDSFGSEANNSMTGGTSDDKPGYIKERLVEPIIRYEGAIPAPESAEEQTLDLLGGKLGLNHQTDETPIEGSRNLPAEEIKSSLGQGIIPIIPGSQVLMSEPLLKFVCNESESQAPELTLQTSSPKLKPQQFQGDATSILDKDKKTCDVTEASEDVGPQTENADKGSNNQ